MAINTNSVQFVAASSQVVTVSNPTALNGLSAMTLLFWAKVTTLDTSKGFIGRTDGGSNNQFTTASDGSDNTKMGIAISSNAGGFFDNFWLSSTGQIVVNTWAQWAFVFDGSQTGNANRLKVYKDGIQDTGGSFGGSTNVIPAALTTITQNMQWGNRASGEGNYLTGLLDEVAIYNRALTPVQIIGYSQTDQTGNSGLIEYWKNNDGTGTTTTAVVGTNGILDNSNQWSTDVPFVNYLATASSGLLNIGEI